MKIFFDCEFVENGYTIDLISWGGIREDGAEYYAIYKELNPFRLQDDQWLRENVLPSLPLKRHVYGPNTSWSTVPFHFIRSLEGFSSGQRDEAFEWTDKSQLKSRAEMAEELIQFAGDKPEFWSWYADYDWVATCQIFGRMIDLPKGWPMYCNDIKQLQYFYGLPDSALPKQTTVQHNALSDAYYHRQLYGFTLHQTFKTAPAGYDFDKQFPISRPGWGNR